MTTGIIELNDAGVRVGVGDEPDARAESPGVAVIDKKDLLLGDAALAQARLKPVQTNSRFWHRLSTEPLPLQHSRYRHHADLAYSHLLSVHQTIAECDDIVFALPGSFTRQQISLLLGIVGQCPFDAVGLVDSAVAASVPYANVPSPLHIDLQLHQCVFTRMRRDRQLERVQVEVLPHCGLLALYEQWAKIIADQFIDQSRFDPLHSATAEQSLYDQLPAWLRQSRDSSELFLEISGKSIKMTREQLVGAVQPIYRQIIAKSEQLAHTQSQVLLADRLAVMPGLLETFDQSARQNTQSLPTTALMEGIQANMALIRTGSDQLSFIQTLPLAEPATGMAEAPADSEAPEPKETSATHLLLGSTAYPLNTARLEVDLDSQRIVEGSSAAEAQLSIRKQGGRITLVPYGNARILVNGEPVNDNCLLSRGDSISVEGGTARPATPIEVLAGDGS